MPAEGMVWQPRSELLTFEEIERVARLMVDRFGFSSIRLTGGEPTMRAHLPVLVGKLAALDVDLSLTTNGATLGLLAQDLAASGLRRVNISCDSLQPDRFAELTRRPDLPRVLDGIDAAIAADLSPVKINVVVMRGINDDEVVDFARFGRERGLTVRFIEFMPLDADGAWSPDQVMPAADIISTIDAAFSVTPVRRGHEPAERFRYLDGAGEVGVIASVTRPFCESCDRVRLTADGQLRNCLFATEESDLRAVLRSGAGDEALAEVVRRSVGTKGAGHAINQAQFIRPHRSMSQIGG